MRALTTLDRSAIIARDRCCLRCGASSRLTVDHVIPLSRGGTNDSANLQTLCRKCNASKGNRTCDDYRAEGVESVEFRPRKVTAATPAMAPARFSANLRASTWIRIEGLGKRTALSKAKLIERALMRALPIFEEDTREIMKDPPLPTSSIDQEGDRG